MLSQKCVQQKSVKFHWFYRCWQHAITNPILPTSIQPAVFCELWFLRSASNRKTWNSVGSIDVSNMPTRHPYCQHLYSPTISFCEFCFLRSASTIKTWNAIGSIDVDTMPSRTPSCQHLYSPTNSPNSYCSEARPTENMEFHWFDRCWPHANTNPSSPTSIQPDEFCELLLLRSASNRGNIKSHWFYRCWQHAITNPILQTSMQPTNSANSYVSEVHPTEGMGFHWFYRCWQHANTNPIFPTSIQPNEFYESRFPRSASNRKT